ncbi:hypothetical protein NP493_508g01039 [Ridgeia piscesae]|uniref:Chitin-binding type-2 domain-containing protein n=1 Tax=Ridgeia piscesae TaxID=27915 RepID=A0AAD9KWW6_RIDPI|nr:hypothetical protein NP493_508g01039 [Ridgeia piscesae]
MQRLTLLAITLAMVLTLKDVEVSAETTTGSNCIRDCTGRNDTDYQSCNGCNVYATCLNGIITDNQPCPAGLVWDEEEHSCEYTSPTCSLVTATICVDDCTNVPDGHYQSCTTCNGYVSCVAGVKIDRPCAPASPPLEWDDSAHECIYDSTTW